MPESVPFFGGATTVNVSASFSGSVPASLTATGTSSAVVTFSPAAEGASFTGVTMMETVATAESSLPSFALKVKESVPLKLGFGL